MEIPEINNFYSSFTDLNKIQIKNLLEENGWASRKLDFTDFELVNSWSELLLEGDDDEPLLNGRVKFNQENISMLNKLFSSLKGEYVFEFYDEYKNLIFEKKSIGSI